MELCWERRGANTTFHYLVVGRVELTSEMPLADVLFDFYDRLKSVTQGYGSSDYEMLDYRDTDLVKVDILVNSEPVDALAQLVHRDKARPRALHYCERLADTIPRQQYTAIQGATAARSSPGRLSTRTVKTSLPSVTAATSAASASFWRSRRRARRG